MKRYILASVLLIMYVLFSAKSCSESEQDNAAMEQAKIKSSKDSIIAAFVSESLTFTSINSFNHVAEIRFADFTDYLTIISDTSLAFSFRAQAKKMAGELFISERCEFRVGLSDGSIKKFDLKELFEVKDSNNQSLHISKPDSIWVMKGLQRVSDTVFAGKIGFSFANGNKSGTQEKYTNFFGNIDFFAVKRQKNFGKQALKVWTIFFGDGEMYAPGIE